MIFLKDHIKIKKKNLLAQNLLPNLKWTLEFGGIFTMLIL